MQLRPYQQEAIDAVMAYWARGGGNPLAELATGTGKSLLIASLTKDLLASYPDMRVLMLVHVQELVEQNFKALIQAWPQAPVGIYSAGLGRRDRFRPIIFGSIQSLYRHDRYSIGDFDLVLIDEAHLVPKSGEGMYQTLLGNLRRGRPDLRVCGFTATPFRMDSGRLDEGDGRLFSDIVFNYGIGPAVADGWLTPLVSRPGATEIDVSSVAKRGGEFVAGALEAVSNRDEITRAAIAQLLTYGQDRRSWLVFCAGVKHAHDFRDALRAVGISAECVTAETPTDQRRHIIQAHKSGQLRALVGMNVMTTGYDNPRVDLLVMLRSTLSTGLYLQMVGRGTRTVWPDGFDPNTATPDERCAAIASGPKPDTLVLDFAGNVRRHGPVDVVEPPPLKSGKSAAVTVDTVRAKECPACISLVGLATRTCPYCGHEWIVDAKPAHEREADTTPILSRVPKLAQVDEVPVIDWQLRRHEKYGSPDSVCVTYQAGLMTYREWVALEHSGFARDKAERWWRQHGGTEPFPATVTDALRRMGELTPPETIQVRKNGKWFDIVGRRFAPVAEEAA